MKTTCQALVALCLFLVFPVLSFGVIASLFAVIYKALPQAPLSWGDVWIGSAFTAARRPLTGRHRPTGGPN